MKRERGGCREPLLLIVTWCGRGYSVFGVCVDFEVTTNKIVYFSEKTSKIGGDGAGEGGNSPLLLC